MGTGFTLPPDVAPLPDLRARPLLPEEALIRFEAQMVARINEMLIRHGRKPLDHFSQLYADVEGRFLMTFPELDHHTGRVGEVYRGTWSPNGGAPPEWPPCDGPKIFAYLKREEGPWRVDGTLRALSSLPAATLAYIPRPEPELLALQNASLRISSRPVDVGLAASECDLAVLHATAGATTEFLRRGVPVILLPLFLEQAVTALRVIELGAGVVLRPHRASSGIGAQIGRLSQSGLLGKLLGRLRRPTQIMTNAQSKRFWLRKLTTSCGNHCTPSAKLFSRISAVRLLKSSLCKGRVVSPLCLVNNAASEFGDSFLSRSLPSFGQRSTHTRLAAHQRTGGASMRRTPCSWNKVLAQLGFRRVWRKEKKTPPLQRLRPRFEALEDRRLMARDATAILPQDAWRDNVDVAATSFAAGDFTLSSIDWTGKGGAGRALASGYSLGIDSGVPDNNVEAFDPGEAWTMAFDRAGELTAIDFEAFGVEDADKAQLVIGEMEPIPIGPAQMRAGVWRPAEPLFFESGQSLRIIAAAPSPDELKRATEVQIDRRAEEIEAGRIPQELFTPTSVWTVSGVHVVGRDADAFGGYIDLARREPTEDERREGELPQRNFETSSKDADDELRLESVMGADVQITAFGVATDKSKLKVSYVINPAPLDVATFNINVYRSTDGTLTGKYGAALNPAQSLSGSATSGTFEFAANLGADTGEDDYYLIAVVENAQDLSNGNVRVFDGGFFLDATANLFHFHSSGATTSDAISVGYHPPSDEYHITWNGSGQGTQDYQTTAHIVGFRLHTHLGNDTINATDADFDVGVRAFGGAGNNNYYASKNNDFVRGAHGIDTVYGGVGHDKVRAGNGFVYDPSYGTYSGDFVYGEDGEDELHGDDGPDWLDGGADDDLIYGGDEVQSGHYYTDGYGDMLWGGEGYDVIFGGNGGDLLYGGNGADLLYGDGHDDRLYGQVGDDVLIGGTGANTLDWGQGVTGAHDPILVTTLVDENESLGNVSFGLADLSLREAISIANTVSGDDAIQIAVVGETQLQHNQLSITGTVSIAGPGMDDFTIRAQASARSVVTNSSSNVTISGLTITGGDTPHNGGAIQADGPLTLRESRVTGNTAGNAGGGVMAYHDLTIDSTIVGDNVAGGAGGGIWFGDVGDLQITASTIDGNAADYGAGLLARINDADAVSIKGSTFSRNQAEFIGGAMLVQKSGGTIASGEILNSTISGNDAYYSGGLRLAYGAEFDIRNTTIARASMRAGSRRSVRRA